MVNMQSAAILNVMTLKNRKWVQFWSPIHLYVFWLAPSWPLGSVCGYLGLVWKSCLFTGWCENFSVVTPLLVDTIQISNMGRT